MIDPKKVEVRDIFQNWLNLMMTGAVFANNYWITDVSMDTGTEYVDGEPVNISITVDFGKISNTTND